MTDDNTSESALPPLVVNGQYVKDLSFEVPGAPAIYSEMQGQNPNIPIHVDINANSVAENTFEVTLHLKVEARLDDNRAVF
ncbi:MAG: protein-export chaperone SecB, partial [Rhodospirillaceae bacterium]|nr:protein-export chaperone SecB [Rhodospirillales bacterium]